MNLGNIKDVVFLQTDPTMGSIGNIVYNLNKEMKSSFNGPRPIDSYDRLGFTYHKQLDDAYNAFVKQQDSKKCDPFFVVPGIDGSVTNFATANATTKAEVPNERKQYTNSITSFLCTKAAYNVFKAGGDALKTFEPKFEQNYGIVNEVEDFVRYAIAQGKRGSPHRC
jgi:hypothetical protein